MGVGYFEIAIADLRQYYRGRQAIEKFNKFWDHNTKEEYITVQQRN